MRLINKKEQKSVTVNSVIVELTPQEVATIAAALGVSSHNELKRALLVNGDMILNFDGATELHDKMIELTNECEGYEEVTI
jgi:hypothetical protein